MHIAFLMAKKQRAKKKTDRKFAYELKHSKRMTHSGRERLWEKGAKERKSGIGRFMTWEPIERMPCGWNVRTRAFIEEIAATCVSELFLLLRPDFLLNGHLNAVERRKEVELDSIEIIFRFFALCTSFVIFFFKFFSLFIPQFLSAGRKKSVHQEIVQCNGERRSKKKNAERRLEDKKAENVLKTLKKCNFSCFEIYVLGTVRDGRKQWQKIFPSELSFRKISWTSSWTFHGSLNTVESSLYILAWNILQPLFRSFSSVF